MGVGENLMLSCEYFSVELRCRGCGSGVNDQLQTVPWMRRDRVFTLSKAYAPLQITILLKHKDSFGKAENFSKTFFTEILIFHRDYDCKSSSSIGLL